MGPAILAPTKYAQMLNLNDVIVDFPNMKIVVEHIGYPWSENPVSYTHLDVYKRQATRCKTRNTASKLKLVRYSIKNPTLTSRIVLTATALTPLPSCLPGLFPKISF